jgi:hypothetical protein
MKRVVEERAENESKDIDSIFKKQGRRGWRMCDEWEWANAFLD